MNNELLAPKRTTRDYQAGWDLVLVHPVAKECADSVAEGAADFETSAPSTKMRRGYLLVKWVKMHKKTWREYEGREFDEGHLFSVFFFGL